MSFDERLKMADAMFEAGSTERAREMLEAAAEEAAADPRGLIKAGKTAVRAREPELYEKYFAKAVELMPTSGEAQFHLGNVMLLKGDTGEALEAFAKAELYGLPQESRGELYLSLSKLCAMKNDPRGALENLKKYEAISGHSDDRGVISDKLLFSRQAGDIREARKCAAKLTALLPYEMTGYMNACAVETAAGNYERALALIEEAERYASPSAGKKTVLALRRADVYNAMAESGKNREETVAKAEKVIRERLAE